MATTTQTTPLRPLELPPFQLNSLLPRVFVPSALPSTPSAPSSPPQASLARFGQLVSNVTAGATGAAAGDPTKVPSVRSVEASGKTVWIGASDGRVRRYEVDEESVLWERSRSPAPPGSRAGSPWSGSSGGRRTPTTSPTPKEVISGLDLLDETVVTQGRKAADRIALMERLGKAVLLSEGLMTFHSLPTLAPLPVHAFPAMKGVTTFALDDAELVGGGSPGAVHICAIKRRSVHLLKVTNDGVTQLKELALRSGALISVFRKRHVCIADAENYSIIDFDAEMALPLLPISQAPNEDDQPPSTSATSSTPPPPGFDPRQRPAVACVGKNEFLIASHTGSTTLGVFVTESGDPCRGTLEWGSNLRSLVVDMPYAAALLFNDTIEIHSVNTQEIVQVIQLPKSSPSSPFALQPRSLIRSWEGLELGAATGGTKTDVISLPLLPSTDGPRTPTRRREASDASSVSKAKGKGKATAARTILVGKNSVHALTPLTLVVQADALMEKGRFEEALSLADQLGDAEAEGELDPDLAYVYLRAAFHSMDEVLFQDAFKLFLRSRCDPRLVVRMFPDLRDPLLRPGEEITVPKGVSAEVVEGKTVDSFILSNLNRNYSPHIKPNVENASPTMELRAMLGTTARDCAMAYLSQWRQARRGEAEAATTTGAGDSRKVDMVVDTTLVRLLAEEGKSTEIVDILEGPNDCVLQQVEPHLIDSGMYQILASIYLKRGEVAKTLEIWTKIVDGEYIDANFTGGLDAIFDLLWKTKEKFLLFLDPKQTLTFETRDLVEKIRSIDADAADTFLESTVLQRRDTDSGLHADLVKRYIGRLGELLADPATKVHLRDQETAYAEAVASAPTAPPTFLSFIAERYSPNSSQITFDRVRLKTILFLGKSKNYDVAGTKKDLEEMEVKGLRGLTLERAIVYGKLRVDRQALSLLLNTLQDLSSAETYCHQSGDPLLAEDLTAIASILSLPMPKSKKASALKKDGEEVRKSELARLLVEMCLAGSGAEGGEDVKTDGAREVQVARILETQALRLDTLEVLPQLPAQWTLSRLSPFLTRSLRRSLHSRHEAALLKALAVSQNLTINDRLGELQVRLGPTVQKDGEIKGATPLVEPAVVKLVPKEQEKGENAGDGTVDLDLR
ncbi:TGF beta receptor associated protein [Pseudohyphozyma bogoriensis]|nr:TGF beta receptor associated protein [Pseudohyphozyma bogoriensis]